MFLLTLARYILEYSLLDYTFVTSKESLKAAASLYLAFKMCLKSVDANEFNKVTGTVYNITILYYITTLFGILKSLWCVQYVGT